MQTVPVFLKCLALYGIVTLPPKFLPLAYKGASGMNYSPRGNTRGFFHLNASKS